MVVVMVVMVMVVMVMVEVVVVVVVGGHRWHRRIHTVLPRKGQRREQRRHACTKSSTCSRRCFRGSLSSKVPCYSLCRSRRPSSRGR